MNRSNYFDDATVVVTGGKVMKKVGVFILLMIVLLGCSGKFDSMREKGDAFFEEGKFENALEEYELALDIQADGEVKERVAQINTYMELEGFIADTDWLNANKRLDEWNEDMVDEPLRQVILEQKEVVREMFATEQALVNQLDQIKSLIKHKELDEAEDLLGKFSEEEMAANFIDVQEELTEEIKVMKAKQEEAEKIAREQKEEEEAERKVELKQKYLAIFDELERVSQAEIASIRDDSFSMYVNKVFEKAEIWDLYMNEVYQIIKGNMSEAEFATLKEEQSAWLQEKEAEMNNDAYSYEVSGQAGGEPKAWIEYESTRDRCYDLVQQYFN